MLNVIDRCVTNAPMWMGVCLSLVGFLNAEGGATTDETKRCAVSKLYVRKASWQKTMLDLRARLAPFLAEQQLLLDSAKLGPWHATAPLKAEKLSDRLFPEDGVDLEAKDADGGALWQKRAEYEDRKVHGLPRQNPCSTYLFRTITAEKPLSLVAGFGSNEGLEVWLNGRKLLSHDVNRNAEHDQELVVLKLGAGENGLLLKVFNRTGGSAFYFSLQVDPVSLLWQRVVRDFPLEAGRMMRDLKGHGYLEWFRNNDSVELEQQMIRHALDEIRPPNEQLEQEFEKLRRAKASADDRRWLDFYVKVIKASRRIDTGLLDAPLLFVKRHPYMAGHIYDDYLTWHPGGGIYVIEKPAAPFEQRKIRAIIDPNTPETLGVGVYRDPDISWDGKRVVFAFKGEADGDTSIYEIGIDGRGLRRLTNPGLSRCTHLSRTLSGISATRSRDSGSDAYVCDHISCPKDFPTGAIGTGRHDVTPAYLPDGRIVFTSTRPAGRVPCFNSLVDVLHVMNSDGTGIRCISVNNVNEFDPTPLPDGRILYGRWEYVDKTALYMQSLWTIFPDGTNETSLFANNLAKPTALLDTRPVPGTHLIVASLTPHNGQAVGAIGVIDPHLGKNNLEAIANFTPKYPTEIDQGLKKGPSDPWPLSKDVILISNNDEEVGPHGVIEMVDRFGHRQLVHAEPDISCYSPMLVKPRSVAKTLSTQSEGGVKPGRFFVQDVYRGLKGVRRGKAKWLRVIEETTRVSGIPSGGRWWNQAFLVSWQGAYTVKNILGVVPVNEDGSIYFEAPAGRALYFELLDDEGREIQRMRSFVQAASGVTRSCIGCHENKMTAPRNGQRPLARLYPPAKPKSESWGGGFIDYPTMIQPILDRRCVSCHGGQEGIAGGIDLSGGWTWAFNISYETLIKNTLVGFLNCHNSSVNTSRILPPRTHGSGAAPLTELLISGHKGRIGGLTRKERDIILAWMDTNCNYYGTWNWTEPATCGVILSAGKQIVEVMRKANCTRCHGEQIGNDWVNLRRPERSRILRAPLAKRKEGLGLAWCRDRTARAVLPLVNGSVQPPDVFRPKRTPAPHPDGKEVISFASTADRHYQEMSAIIRGARQKALAEPRVDMPGAKINPGIYRQLVPVPLPKRLPALRAELNNNSNVDLSWQRSAGTIGLTFELHRGKDADFTPTKKTLMGTTTMFQFEDEQPPTGTVHYALVAISDKQRSKPVYTALEVPPKLSSMAESDHRQQQIYQDKAI